MYPILIQWGNFALPAWHAMYATGAALALVILLRLARVHCPQINPRFFSMLFIVTYISGYFGARTYSLLIEDFSVKSLLDLLVGLTQFGSMTFYGGALAAFGAGVIYTLIQRIPVPEVFDLAIPPALVALAIGRIGCFLNGDDFGLPIDLEPGAEIPLWAVVFPNLADGIPRYPVQMVSALLSVMLAGFLIIGFRYLRRRFGTGSVGYLGVTCYAVGRIVIERYRGDERGVLFAGVLTPAQVTSVLILIAISLTFPLWLKHWRRL